MKEHKINPEIAAHNIATILTQASITEIDKGQIPISANAPHFDKIREYSEQYSYIYNEFYYKSYNYLVNILDDDV